MKTTTLLFVSGAFVLATAGALYANQSSEKAATANNMKQLVLASIIYSADYDDIICAATNTRSFAYCIQPYDKNPALWRSQKSAPGVIEFNLALAGADSNEVDAPNKVAYLFESKPWKEGDRRVAFVDGSVKTQSEAEWKEVSKTLKQKFKGTKKRLPPTYGFKEIPADFRKAK